MALFGQFNLRFTQDLELTASLRANEEEISVETVNNLAAQGGASDNSDTDSEVVANLKIGINAEEDQYRIPYL